MDSEKGAANEQQTAAQVVDILQGEPNGEQYAQPPADTVKAEPSDAKRKPWWIAAAAVVAVVVIAAVMLFRGRGASSKTAEPLAISANITEEGIAYILLPDGKAIEIDDDVEYAVITKDRKHIIVQQKGGRLYVTDTDQKQKTSITGRCASVSYIRDDGFFYTDNNEAVYRVLFDGTEALKVGENINLVAAAHVASAVYADDDGNIYTLANTDTEARKVDTSSDDVKVKAVSDDAEIAVWTTGDSLRTVMLSDGGESTALGRLDSKYDFTHATFTKDQGLAVIDNSDSDRLWIKYPGQEAVEAKLGAELAVSTVYTDKGPLYDMQSGDVTGLLVETEAEEGDNIYAVTLDGDRERLLSGVTDFSAAGGYLFYTDADKDLHCGKLDGDTVADETKIASDVDVFEVTSNGRYVYYMKDCEQGRGVLYCYKVGAEEPIKIDTDAACMDTEWDFLLSMYTTYSVDGASVFYYKDMEDVADTRHIGTLMLWTYGGEDAEKIAGEVLTYSVSSSLDTGEVQTDGFKFMKYDSVDDEENVHANLMYFDGKKTTKIAEDVIL